jgi:hypothetical protein
LDCCSFTVDPLGSGWIRPFSATMGSSDSRTATFAQCGSLRFLGFSFPARRLHPPRGARWVRSSVSATADFGFSGSVVTPFGVTRPNRVHLCCGSQASRASPWGLLLSAPGRLHDGHYFVMRYTFQFSRDARLSLTHQRAQRGKRSAEFFAFYGSPFIEATDPINRVRLRRSKSPFRLQNPGVSSHCRNGWDQSLQRNLMRNSGRPKGT